MFSVRQITLSAATTFSLLKQIFQTCFNFNLFILSIYEHK